MQDGSQKPEGQTVGEAAEELTRSVTELVGAVFGVGAAVAKTAAEATSGGKPIPEPSANQGPLNLIIHYGLTAAANLVRTVVSTSSSAAGAAGQARTGASSSPQQTASTPAGPAVTAGATLRIPLSIENPAAEPINTLGGSPIKVATPPVLESSASATR